MHGNHANRDHQRSWLQRLAIRLIERALKRFGRSYQPSPDIPIGLLFRVLAQRASWLLRGLLRLRRPVFLGPRVRILGKRRLQIGTGATLERGVHLDCYGSTRVLLGQRSKIGAMSIVSVTSHLSHLGSGLRLGDDSSLGEYCYLGAAGGIDIGSNVIMGQYVTFHSQDHVIADSTKLIRDQGTTQRGIVIGDDCWIGARATFLDGCVLGPHSVVGAGAVVLGEFPPYSIIAGVPARAIGSRRLAQE